MGKGKAQAQAVAQRTQAITNQDSFQLVKCLLRVSVYHVCWMRGLFPESSFTGHDLAQLDQLHVKMLEPNEEDDEASTLKNWVEQGVMDAVANGYLKNMYFGIASDAAATNLLEEFIYSFKYGEDGVQFGLKAAHGKQAAGTYSSKGKERPGVDDVRYQVVRLMRMLVQLCQTLDKVPEERYLFMKLTYHDHTPQEYEPPFFHGVKEEGMGYFDRRPFSMDVGHMDTHHHKVTVRVKSVLDSCGDDEAPADQAMEEMMASQQITVREEAAGSKGSPDDAGDEDMADADAEAQDPPPNQQDTAVGAAAADLSPQLRTEEALALLTATEDPNGLLDAEEGLQGPTNPQGSAGSQGDLTCRTDDMEAEGGESAGGSGGGSGQGAYEAVRDFCLVRPAVAYVDLMATFYDLSEDQLGKVLDGLQREGLIQPGLQEDTYTVLHPTTAAAPHFQPPTTSEGIMAEAGGAGSGGSVAAAGMHASAHKQQQLLAEEDQMLTNQMSGLSVGAAAAAAAHKARGVAGANASVYGAAMRAGSLMTGQPGVPTAAPTAATPQVNTAADGEPSVQLQQEQQGLWLDASQQSFQGPKPADAAGAGAAGTAAAGNGGKTSSSRLRKASYVNNPIYQHPGKRGPASRLHQQQEQEQQQDAAGEARDQEPSEQTRQQQEQQQHKKAAAPTGEAAGAMQAPAGRKKVTARKPKKPAAATNATAGTPTRGRMAAMRS